jgi:hypothetical protein
LHAIGQLQLAEDAAHVGLDGGLGGVQLRADLAVGHASGHQAQHVDLSGRQGVWWSLSLGGAAQLLQHLQGDARVQRGLAAIDLPDGLDQVSRFRIFEQVA